MGGDAEAGRLHNFNFFSSSLPKPSNSLRLMSKNKRVKSHNAGGTAVKDASKKKRKTDSRAIKFKNAELKATLDNQAHLLYQPISTVRISPYSCLHV